MQLKFEVAAFDVIGTLFSLDTLRPKLQAVGLPANSLELWFAELLRDAFALIATGQYRPFRDVAAAALTRLAGQEDALDASRVDQVLDGFAHLDPYPDAATGMQRLRDRDVRIVALTNGGADVTDSLLGRSGLGRFVECCISVDEVKSWKPATEVYLHCARKMGVVPDRLALVAAHDWDIHGARCAGLLTGYVSRRGASFSTVMTPPHVSGSTLVKVVDELLR